MADLQIGDELSAALHQMAASENLSIEALLSTLVERYRHEKGEQDSAESPTSTTNLGWREEALNGFVGMFDDDVTDLSESIHDSVVSALRKKYDRPR
jgi:hypothetical protein